MHDYFPQLIDNLSAMEPDEAIAALRDAAATRVRDPRPAFLIAAEYAGRGDADRAEAYYLIALDRAPDLAIARFQLGLLQMTTGRPATASVTWSPLDDLAEDAPLRLFKDGLAFLAEGELAKATELLIRGISNNVENGPLNRDMQHIVSAIESAQGGKITMPGSAALHPQPKPGNRGAAQGSGVEHFLLSSYRRLH